MPAAPIFYTPPRVIPNWEMDKPWTEPSTQEEQEGTATLIFLSNLPGIIDIDRVVTAFIQNITGDNINALRSVTA